MGSLQLEPANIIKPPIISPSSPLHASDFDEERYLAGGARGFYMNGANVEEGIHDKEKVISGTVISGYDDERKESRSSGYGDEHEKRSGGARSTLGQLQNEKNTITSDDDGGSKNKSYLGYGAELQKKAATTRSEPLSFGMSGDEKKAGARSTNIGANYYDQSKRERGSAGDGRRRKRGSLACRVGAEISNGGKGFSFFGSQKGSQVKRGRVALHADQREKRERWSAYEREEIKRGRGDLNRDQGNYERERGSGINGGDQEEEEQVERRERGSANGREERKKRGSLHGKEEEEEEGEERERWRAKGEEEKEKRVAWRANYGGEERRKKRQEDESKKEGEVDYVHRGQWLRAAILGANDGLVSTASLMMGVGAVKEDDAKAMIISGLAGLVAGACSMAIGEFVSVYSQRDAETFDKTQKKLHLQGPLSHGANLPRDLEEGHSHDLNLKHGSHDFTRKDVSTHIISHANKQEVLNGGVREESKKQGKQQKKEDNSTGPSPWEAAGASGLAFALGAMVPLLSASFIKNQTLRLGVMMGVSSGTLMCMGAVAAKLSAGSITKGGVRVLLGGWVAMLITYGLLRLFRTSGM